MDNNFDIENSPFLKACRLEQASHTPIWLMRQAGRYMPSYKAIRSKFTMLELCQRPEEVTEVTLLPINKFGFDAAILFSDITIPFLGMGVDFDIVPGVGPVIENPITSLADVRKLIEFDVEDKLSFIARSVELLKGELKVPLIGFAGAPFTLAAYMIEGKPSRDFKKVREFMYTEPEAWEELMSHLTKVTFDYLAMQHRAGADVLQLFDSWVGGLHPETYKTTLFPHMSELFTRLKKLGALTVHFGTGTASLLPLMREAGGDVIGIDWKTPLGEAWKSFDYKVAVQGNLDPTVLLAPFDVVKKEVDRILAEAAGRPGHIFNLGHGILPPTPEDTVSKLVDYVKEQTQR